jgi:hypothetical protein
MAVRPQYARLMTENRLELRIGELVCAYAQRAYSFPRGRSGNIASPSFEKHLLKDLSKDRMLVRDAML